MGLNARNLTEQHKALLSPLLSSSRYVGSDSPTSSQCATVRVDTPNSILET